MGLCFLRLLQCLWVCFLIWRNFCVFGTLPAIFLLLFLFLWKTVECGVKHYGNSQCFWFFLCVVKIKFWVALLLLLEIVFYFQTFKQNICLNKKRVREKKSVLNIEHPSDLEWGHRGKSNHYGKSGHFQCRTVSYVYNDDDGDFTTPCWRAWTVLIL